ncbi:Fe-S cluster assembly protein SufD [Nocardioides sp. TRM66260-LWL]|uniref:Fe-S cluster assembly protein SufD n=1 Tax=Nocardioides sp. TRM66260-LWL TaxID=2874478 RepID=UPI001CC345F3|nr:Fe-S cluster assembly protein SufD [Nocardioides sp. TRM66260-LWL]MBZ5733905.1 Fe-S cluster assembly protein SufD [Nocardioides sp. TRM66260-LWL]
MTVTQTPAETVAGAVEAAPGAQIESHLNPPPSYDLGDHPAPTGREEIWRFTPLKRLGGLLEAPASAPVDLGWAAAGDALPAGVTLTTVSDAEARELGEVPPNDRPSALVVEHADVVRLLDVPAEAELDEPIVLDLRGTSAEDVSLSRTIVRIGRFAQATIVLLHSGSARHSALTSYLVGDGANVTVLTLQDWDDDAVHLGRDAIRVGRDATVRHAAVTFGGDLVRLNANVEYDGPGGSAELLGLYFADAGQHLEHRLFVDHNQPRTSSNVVYKGALQGERAHTVWIGNVLIRKVAEGIETYEENRNLVLTDGCQADSVPNLEIETGEIEGAGHASATARFDDEQLFYLRSRGIADDEARRLVLEGFFADLIRKVGVPALEERMTASVERELARTVRAGETA